MARTYLGLVVAVSLFGSGFAGRARAAEGPAIVVQAPEVEYVAPQEDVKFLPVNQVRDVQKLTDLLQKFTLVGLNDNFGDGQAFMGVDQVFTDPDFKIGVFLKLDRKPVDETQLGKLFVINKSYLYNGRFNNGLYFVLYFVDFEPGRVKGIVSEIQANLEPKRHYAKRSRGADFLLPSLYAESVPLQHFSMQEPRAPRASATPTSREQAREVFHITMQGLKECAMIFAQTKFVELKHATWDTAIDVAKRTVDLADRSFQTVKHIFQGKVSMPSFDDVWRTVTKVWHKLAPTQVGHYLGGYIKDMLGDLKHDEKKVPGQRTRENCRLISKIGAKLELAAASFFIPGGPAAVAWDALSKASTAYRVKDELQKWMANDGYKK